MRTALSSKGQLVLPADLRERDKLHPGQVFEVERIDPGDYRLRRLAPAPNEGLLDWLLSCPGDGLPLPALPKQSTEAVSPDLQGSISWTRMSCPRRRDRFRRLR